ncbi:MAG: MFS transporter [Actinomycetota bacterium]
MRPPEDLSPDPEASQRSRAARMVRRTVLDLTPLRISRDFRLLWFGELVSHTGRHIAFVALPYQVYQLTGSPLAVGLIGLVQVGPLVLFSLVGGAVADAIDRRRLLLFSQTGSMAASLLLVGGATMERPPLWFLYLAAALSSAFAAFDSPARSAAIPNLVPRERLASAIALNQVLFQVNDVVGPAIAGLIIARFGLVWAYAIDAVTFLAAIATLLAMRPMPPRHEGARPPVLRAVREGFAYLKGRRVLLSTFLIDLDAMIFGMPRALFPVLAQEAFHVGPAGLGLLYAAPAAGALVGAVFTGWVGHVRHQGRAVLWAVSIWGMAIVAFGLSTTAFLLALGWLAIAGGADVISAIFRSTILQSSVPDALRGRLSSIHIMVVVGGPRLGDLEAGVVAQLTSPVVSVVSGGIACVAGVAVLSLVVPQFRRYHAGEPA